MNRLNRLARVYRLLRPLTLLLIFINLANGQTSAPAARPSPSPKPTPSLEKQFLRNILNDQVGLWTSPFRTSRADLKFLVPIGLTTAALIATDRRTADELGEHGGNERRVKISLQLSRPGGAYTSAAIAGTFYLVGVAKHDSRARETGILGGEALIDAKIVYSVLKKVSQRPRPLVPDPDDDFFDGGNSFPSGHATDAWALATVIASEYHDRKAVQVTAYALASAVSLSRYTGRAHFLSDVFVGSVIGYGIGRYVYKKHHVPAIGDETNSSSAGRPTKWIPSVAPLYSRMNRTYGVTLAWHN
jgi:membrane-associated phospholipid phosphatase